MLKKILFIILFLMTFFGNLYVHSQEATSIPNKYVISPESIESVLTSSVMIVSEKINYENPLDPSDNFSLFSNDFIQSFGNLSENNINKKLGLRLSQALGSGFIFKKELDPNTKIYTYNIVTNAHVVNTFTNLWIILSDDSFFPAQIIGMETEYDVAVLEFNTELDLSITKLGDSQNIREGDAVFAIGNPFGISFTVTQGIVSQAQRYTPYNSDKKSSVSFGGPFIQVDAAINKGNSGGVLANAKGEVIGINTFIISNSHDAQNIGLNFAIPINYVMQSVERIFSNTSLKPGWIGILAYNLPLRIRYVLGIKNRAGIFINNIVLSSNAYKAGLRNGDLIIAVDSKKIISRDGYSSIFEEIARKPVGDEVSIEILRPHFQTQNNNNEKNQTENNFKDTMFSPMTFQVTVEDRPQLEISKIQKNIKHSLSPGMLVKPVEDYEKELFGLNENEHGVIITRIFKNTLAEISQLKEQDIIIAVNDTLLKSFIHYIDLMRDSTQNKKLTVLREAQLIDVNLQK